MTHAALPPGVALASKTQPIRGWTRLNHSSRIPKHPNWRGPIRTGGLNRNFLIPGLRSHSSPTRCLPLVERSRWGIRRHWSHPCGCWRLKIGPNPRDLYDLRYHPRSSALRWFAAGMSSSHWTAARWTN